jgi:chaperone modulatory protein CbpM
MTLPSVAPTIVEEALEFTLEELSRCCECDARWLIELVYEGALEPRGEAPSAWRFAGVSLRRARVAVSLHRDLHVNAPGVALALELLDEIHALRVQVDAAP